MAVRDRLVAAVLAAGVLLGLAAWQAFTPVAGVVAMVFAVVVACGIYRVDPSRSETGSRSGDEPPRLEDVTVSTPRRAPRRP